MDAEHLAEMANDIDNFFAGATARRRRPRRSPRTSAASGIRACGGRSRDLAQRRRRFQRGREGRGRADRDRLADRGWVDRRLPPHSPAPPGPPPTRPEAVPALRARP